MTRVLISCPNMIEIIDDVMPIMHAHGWEVDVSDAAQQLRQDDLLAVIHAYDGVIAGDDEFTRAVIERGANGRLRAIAKWGVGTDNIDHDAAGRAGVTVTNTPGVFGDEVADVIVGYLVMLSRHLHRIDAAVRRGEWFKPVGSSLAGTTLGIVGLGSIGSALAVRGRAMGMQIVGSDPSVQATRRAERAGWDVLELDDVVAAASYLALCCPLTASNRHFMDDRRFALMPAGAKLVNTARGPLVDQDALVRALRSGQLGGAALDVFEWEPLPDDDPLRNFDQVILGSHNASNSAQAVQRVTELAIRNLARQLERRYDA